MRAWILSIIGVVFIGIMLEVISPEGKTNAFIKSIFAIVFMYVVITPIINLIKNQDKIDFSNIIQTEHNDYSEQTLTEIKLKIETHLASNGFNGVEVEVVGVSTEEYTKVQKVQVDLSNLVLNSGDEHINKYKLITELIMSVVDIDKENIVYG